MKFEDIFLEWEKKENARAEKADTEKKKMEHWLEQYPPDRNTVSRKEKPDRTIIHTRKKELSRMAVQDTLDLHGWTGNQGLQELEKFLLSAKHRGLIKVLVIHGKGIHSPRGKSVLRPLVQQFLETSDLVKKFGKAKGRYGGGGASWILLK